MQSQIVSEIYQKAEIKTDTELAGLTELVIKIHKLGYRKMPERMYQNWLSNMKSEGRDNFYGSEKINPMATQTNEHSPFVPYGYDKPIVFTASRGMFEEFHDFLDTVEIGNILFDCRKNIIVGFIPEDNIEVRADILPLSVDPHADRYWWITPYAYCNNNPIRIIDPDGRDIYEFDESGKLINQHSNTNHDQIVILSADGQRTGGKQYEYGTIKNDFTRSIKQKDGNSVNVSFLKIMGDQNAKEIFEFAADNTSVEWGLTGVGKESGEKGGNYLSNSQERSHEASGKHVITKNASQGIRGYTHNHRETAFPSSVDLKAAKNLHSVFPNAVMNIYAKGVGHLQYNSRGIIKESDRVKAGMFDISKWRWSK